MKTFTRIVGLTLLLTVHFIGKALAQTGVLNPNDPIVVYNPAAPPATPANGTLAKWVKTNRVGFNTSSFKSYYYKGMAFRLKFPKSYQHNVADGKTYPLLVFFHGVGEGGTIYDNEYQLYHGGELHRNAVDNGNFDGFLLYPQSASSGGVWSSAHYIYIKELIENYFVPQIKVDINRILVNGLSGGGSATWQFTRNYPTIAAGCLPISGPINVPQTVAEVPSLKWTPIWIFQGGLDYGPSPGTTGAISDAYKNAGADMTYTLYPNQGHGCWYSAWGESNYFPYLSKAHKANPWPLTGRTEFCAGDPISVTMGVTAGFTGYEWRKDGVLIPGATGNQITVNSIGTYDCRIKRGTTWSVWSPVPVVIKIKGATIPPTITVSGLMSKVIPSLDGNTGVTLQVPAGYTSYDWRKDNGTTVLGTQRTFYAASPGNYKVKATEQYGCSSDFSAPFTVVDANGPNKPDAASGLIASPLSKTSVRLDWTDNPTPVYNETNYEVYQATQAGGPYVLVAMTGANISTATITGLAANTKYYYKVRAVNNTAASAASNEVSATTNADTQAPTPPTNLSIVGSSRSSISLQWDPSTDDVGVTKYDVYVNGVKAYQTSETQITVYNLQYKTSNNFYVKAKDQANNISSASNQVTGQPLARGLNYKYYTFTGNWNYLPDFNTLAPVEVGNMPNVAITPRTQDDNFAFLWEGFITIPTTGTYYFRTNSDDGSRLWLGSKDGTTSPYNYAGGATLKVDNDGLHGTQDKTSSGITLQAGVYPIAMAFYEQGGGEAMTVRWRTPLSGTTYNLIPDNAFVETATVLGQAPAVPSNLTATTVSHQRINLTWTDNSNNETGFEIWRSTSATSGFSIVGVTSANTTAFADSLDLGPSTTYFYQIRAIGQYGESVFTPSGVSDAQAHWKFNNNYSDASPNNRTLSANNSPTFTTDSKEGSHAVEMNGSNEDITINTSSNDYIRGGYSQKSVAFWMKADNTSNRGVFDLGGADDGLAMRLNSNTLYAGIASNSTRRSISVAYSSTGWNHIALVYSTNTLRLYVNGVQVTQNTSLGFNSVGTTSDGSMIGDDNGDNALNTSFGQFDGRMDNFAIFGKALTVAEINALMNNTYGLATATTQALPALPAPPTDLLASGISKTDIEVKWTDASTIETGFELYRSANNNGNYLLYKTLAANTVSFIDTALQANGVYYYKVKAINDGGASAFSNEDSAATFNSLPVIAAIANQRMRYDAQLALNILSTDADPEVLNISFTGLPTFASYISNSNGIGTLTISPASLSDQGTYNITATVNDQHGGTASTSFTLVVNNNYKPVIGSGNNNTSLNEKQTAQINLTATDQNEGDALTWSFAGLPSFASVNTTNGSAQIDLAPGYADNGTYTVKAFVQDSDTDVDSTTFTITVNDVNPNKTYYINFTSGTYLAGTPWNNTNKLPAINDNFSNLKDATGATSAVGIQLQTAWVGISNTGINTGNNSGVYPDAVLRSSYYTTSIPQSIRIYGLDLGSKHSFTMLGSRGGSTVPYVANYTIGSETVSLDAANNYLNTVSINNLTADPDGSLILTIARAAGSTNAYLNSLVIQSKYDDGTAPAKPRNLTAQLTGDKVRLGWIDAAYNETAYEIYRATTLAGPYTLINPGGNNADIVTYDDANVSGNNTYYYSIRTLNTVGYSAYSDTVSVAIPNSSPVLAAIANVNMATQQTFDVNLSATDSPGDIITLQVSGLPAFATFTDNGNGTGRIRVQPGNTTGTFEGITVTATDNFGASSSRQFNITVNATTITSVYVNFNASYPVGAPWNDMNTMPYATVGITDLKDVNSVSTGINLTLLDKWSSANEAGAITGNNSGVYPDNVMFTGYHDGSGTNRRIKLSGLSSTKKYDLVFFGSRANYTSELITRYSVGAQSVDLNVSSNTSRTVRLTGLVADANGEIEINVNRVGASANSYLGALEIHSYAADAAPGSPINVKANGLAKDKIKIDWERPIGNSGTGYEIWRASSANGTYTKVGETADSVTTFTNSGLAMGSIYYYKVRTIISAGNFSPFSAVASAGTVSYLININFNDVANPQAGAWNNTNSLPYAGMTVSNLITSEFQNTGINLSVARAFSGYHTLGMTTGNNSGVVPDNVMKSFYYVSFGDTAILKVDGLSHSNVYSFTFFGSIASANLNQVTLGNYKIGNEVVQLNALDNTTNTVKISNVRPDENGAIYITIYSSINYTFLNSMMIEGLPIDPSTVTTLASTGTTARTASSLAGAAAMTDVEGGSVTKITTFPNPFLDDVTLSLDLKQNVSKFTVDITDMGGRIIYSRSFSNALKGTWKQRLGLNAGAWNRGLYILRVSGIENEKAKVFRIVK